MISILFTFHIAVLPHQCFSLVARVVRVVGRDVARCIVYVAKRVVVRHVVVRQVAVSEVAVGRVSCELL